MTILYAQVLFMLGILTEDNEDVCVFASWYMIHMIQGRFRDGLTG
jgi:hypothetical protein